MYAFANTYATQCILCITIGKMANSNPLKCVCVWIITKINSQWTQMSIDTNIKIIMEIACRNTKTYRSILNEEKIHKADKSIHTHTNEKKTTTTIKIGPIHYVCKLNIENALISPVELHTKPIVKLLISYQVYHKFNKMPLFSQIWINFSKHAFAYTFRIVR